ncbi:OmpP1/FadL family transporter [Sulfurimonas paralvinellae]|uniref:Aromatic hydrocarbon degradation protein n=1 Tax=Sulfurimonas paralvinellae TaxID=317658 RepID=A0A7M1BA69_9BACT|nr:outer membrane protein transport protein [Sulfurimonas paralvinellae]QOP46637.1 aromatic hydrocarbon degradation protein [Sulfurimonas paralvinellae]
MKKTIKLAVVAALALGATSAFATNGAALIGMGAKARGMAGTGIGMSHGAESALTNPALITTVKSTEISFGGTIFMPDVKNENNLGGGASSSDSDADINVIPEISLATKINDNFYVGVGMWGTGGMGVDYRDAKIDTAGGTQLNMVTNLQLMQFGVPLAYTTDGFSVAITPILQYGSLDINYVYTGAPMATGMGVAQDLAFGYNIGAAYTFDALTIGAVYTSAIDMEYKGFSDVIGNFSAGAYDNDKLSTPAQIGLGASYAFGESTVALDYKRIKWSDAKGYEDFAWDDQDVISIGYEYKTKNWAARAGYNYASSPISEQKNATPNSAGLTGGVINTFNLLGFPAIVQSHYAIGGTYNVSDKASVDAAFTYAAEETNTYTNFAAQDITTKHSQTGVSLQLNYDF